MPRVEYGYGKQYLTKTAMAQSTVYAMLHRHGWRKLAPDKRHPESDPVAQEEWKKLPETISQASELFDKTVPLRLMFQDEARFGRISQTRYCWCPKLMMCESSSLPVVKCIYERLPFPARNAGLERAFIEWAQADTQIHVFCKVSETRHDFVRLRYVKEDGLPAFYSSDFLVCTEQAVYLVETKAQQQTIHPNVRRKLKSVTAWCGRINGLAAELRGNMPWHYVLLGETAFHEWRSKGARLGDLLNYARVRLLADASTQERLRF